MITCTSSPRFHSAAGIPLPILRTALFLLVGPALLPSARADEPSGPPDDEAWAKVLQEFVNDNGLVDYAGLKNERKALDRFVRSLAVVPRTAYASWTDDRRIAFWINAYNGLVLRIVIDYYPIDAGLISGLIYPDNSIRQIDGVFDGITHPVMDQDMTLDDIEHQTLRKDFNEPRIHLALVCAAMSCPRLRTEPYRAGRLDQQFADQAEAFVQNPSHFRMDREQDQVWLSSIFDWFGEDFIASYRPRHGFADLSAKNASVLHYLSDFLSDAEAAYLQTADYDVRYRDYDWSLNEWDRRSSLQSRPPKPPTGLRVLRPHS